MLCSEKLMETLDKIRFYWSKTNRWHRIFLLLLLAELQWVPGSRLGFTCNDPALSHPFTGDTISWKWLIGITALLPFVFIIIVEKKFHHSDKTDKSKNRALKWYTEYLFGLVVNLTFVSILKVMVGEPRPHFFDTCGPKEAETCKGYEFVPRYSCTKAHWVAQSDRSFPSGHTSMAVHAAVFIAWYLHKRITRSHPERLRLVSILQGVCLLSGTFCSVSRLLDHRHHWWDVLAGAAIGLAILYYTIFILCKNFECSSSEKEELTENGRTNESESKTVPNTKLPHEARDIVH